MRINLKILSVIKSCKTMEQLITCLGWINSMAMDEFEKEGYANRIEQMQKEIITKESRGIFDEFQ